MVLFCFLAKDKCENNTSDNPNRKWYYIQENNFCRSAVSHMLDSAEHIAVVVCHYDAHEVGKDEGEDETDVLYFFHGKLFSLYLIR